MNKIIQGNCLDSLKTLPENSVDAIVTDPPYGLSFMGKKWDYDVPSTDIWEECLRVLKPGGYLLAFAGTRTQHRMAVRIEDAGFEIRDMIAWVYGSGFPKSLNIGKVTDKFLKTGNASWNGTGDSSNGALGYSKLQHKQDYRPEDYSNRHQNKDKITEEKAKQWEGWGTALKPALEPITVARKPLSEKTVASNCLKWGTGGINIDESRVRTTQKETDDREKWNKYANKEYDNGGTGYGEILTKTGENSLLGRFPANFIHDGSDEVVGLFPNTKSGSMNGTYKNTMMKGTPGERDGKEIHLQQQASEGNASRFFYCAKSSRSERNKGTEELDHGNNHATVKPIALMEYLVKLVTKENAVVLDPFTGSGSTLVACKNTNRNYIGMELDTEYIKIAEARLNV